MYLANIPGGTYEGPPVIDSPSGTRQVYWGADAPGLPWTTLGPRWVLPTAVPSPTWTTPFQQKEIGFQGDAAAITFPRPNSSIGAKYGLFERFWNPILERAYMWHRASFVYKVNTPRTEPVIKQWPGDTIWTTAWVSTPLQPFPDPLFPWAPSVFPHELPVGSPAPWTPPLNFPRPDPWSPESPSRGPRPYETPAPQPKPVPKPEPLPEPVPNPAPRPNVVQNPFPNAPLDSWLPAPRPNGRPQAQPKPRPPAKHEKEAKARMGRVAGAIWGAFGPITETVDFVDVLYEALPRNLKRAEYKKRGRQPNPIERAELIYKNINQIDVGKALTGYVQNEIEDYVIGQFGKKLGEASRKDNRPIGYGAGWAL